SDESWDPDACRAAGEGLLRDGRIACFTVAGGQGSRLGYDGPKGCYPATPISGKTLFEVFAESIGAAQRKYETTIQWYIMTSPLNHDATTAFFAKHGNFGLEIMFFPQGVMPSFDKTTGRILLSSKSTVATNPDGHGGSFRALVQSGAVADMTRRGIEHISYFQVDNPLCHVVDPVFLGLHATKSSAEMSSKMVPKAYPDEKLGVFCAVDGRVQVIEYSDLPQPLQQERGPDGTLRFLAGSIAIHTMGVEFVTRVVSDEAFALPWHRAVKKVPSIDLETGRLVEPMEPNAVKLEQFVFDALPLCTSSVVYETSREEEFAPIKNATGVDSPESSRRLQTARAARWLEAAGATVPRDAEGRPDCVIELSPSTAIAPEDLVGRSLPRLEPGQQVKL
ncbi:MAG: UDPGP type 1 family protein, partial [Phycisphaerales bacterium]|nr:UDPGP type 1 family protein [Phycisphaerales bacterium]